MIEELVKQIARLQKQVDSLIKPEVGRWIAWTPTVTQSGAVAVTVNYAKYIALADIVILQCKVTATGAGTGNNDIVIGSLPLQPSFFATRTIGTGQVLDNGTAYYNGVLVAVNSNDLRIYVHNFTPAAGNAIGSNPNFALAAGDEISIQGIYEQA